MKQESMARRNIRPNVSDAEIKRLMIHGLNFVDTSIVLARTSEHTLQAELDRSCSIGHVYYCPAESATFMLRVRIKRHKDDVEDLEEIIHDFYDTTGWLRRPEDIATYVRLN
jgi:hypothetical protein